MAETKGIYCVTGANSFVGSHLVKKLLELGYTVHGTIRNLSDKTKTEFLQNLPNSQSLKLFEADLLNQGSYETPIQGCTGVFHCAAPWLLEGKWDDHWKPIVEGTKNVITQSINTPSVKRIVLVSSCAAVYCNCGKFLNNLKFRFCEDDWNSLSDGDHSPECSNTGPEKAYFSSKTAGEREAWKLVQEAKEKDPKRELSLVSINPPVIFGPPLSTPTQETLNTSLKLLPGLFFGGDQGGTGIVDIQDVTEALVRAMTYPNATGRYLCSGGSYHYSELSSILAKLFPDRCFAEDGHDESVIPVFNVEKIKRDFEISFTPIEDTLKRTVEAMIQKNCLPSF